MNVLLAQYTHSNYMNYTATNQQKTLAASNKLGGMAR